MGLEPSLPASQISELPERWETKAMRLPSGDSWTERSARVEAINFRGWFDEPSSSYRQMLGSKTDRSKTSLFPLGGNHGL